MALGHNRYSIREKANFYLKRLGELNFDPNTFKDEEVRRRLEFIVSDGWYKDEQGFHWKGKRGWYLIVPHYENNNVFISKTSGYHNIAYLEQYSLQESKRWVANYDTGKLP